ncbi:gamma-aminobutyric acid type B receptor subunit 2 [Elysia marginata]|uniref:Gamma-aminobutyric acid type B receptor subunit 2 n=1 Tax=Elysia marginata TaxID=1093978 RepID=A0AAV4FT34_9GAST|nr:gamma-aminobutyric acid type B receptor subunit 2 [Elysia marginata]
MMVIETMLLFFYSSWKPMIYWFMAEYIVKGLLLVFGAFLAWETRKVTIPALNDSKLIGFCIYNITVVCALAVPVVHVLGQDKPTLTYLLVGLFVSLCTTLVLCILFIPKIRLRNQVSERRFVSSLHASGQQPQPPQPGGGHPNHYSNNSHAQSAGGHMTFSLSARPPDAMAHTASDVVVSTNTRSGHLATLAVPNNSSPSSGQMGTSISSLAEPNDHNGGCWTTNSTTTHKLDRAKQDVNTLESEVARLTAVLTEELQAVAGLKNALVTESQGRLQFHKVGKDYVIFKGEQGTREVTLKEENFKGSELRPQHTIEKKNAYSDGTNRDTTESST